MAPSALALSNDRMSTTATAKSHPSLSMTERVVIGLHALAALGVGIAGLLGATDSGWVDLQRIATVLLVGGWIVGIVVTGLVVRYLLSNRWARLALLVAGPFLGIAAVVAIVRIG